MDLPASATTEEARRVFCVYPVSGTYTSFQRSLFYLTTALALLGHSHEWLTAACLAFTVSYSSTAAIHALALAPFQGDSLLHHDSDFLAVDLRLFLAVVTVRFLQLYWFLRECIPFLMVVDSPIRFVVRKVFRFFRIRKLRIEDLSYLEPEISHTRYQATKYAALLFYIMTTLGYVAWILVVAPLAMGGATGFLARIPESETFRAVDQWSPWLTISLAIATTLLTRLLVSDQLESMDS